LTENKPKGCEKEWFTSQWKQDVYQKTK